MSDEMNTPIPELGEAMDKPESLADSQDTNQNLTVNDPEGLESLNGDGTNSGDDSISATNRAEAQKEAWARNIIDGKKTLADLEANPALKWMLGDVKARLGVKDYSKEVSETIQAHESKKQFEADMSQIKEMPREDANKAIRKANWYMDKAKVGREIALRMAMEELQPEFAKQAEIRKERVSQGQMPVGKSSLGTSQYTEEYLGKITSKAEFNRVMSEIESGKAEIIK